MQRHSEALLHFKDLRSRLKKQELPGSVFPELCPSLAATAKLAERLGYMTAVQGNSVEFITDDEIFVDCVVEGINQAQHEV